MSTEQCDSGSSVEPDLSTARQHSPADEAGSKSTQDLPQSSKKAPGLLGNWLRRSQPQQQSSHSNLVVKTASPGLVADPGTPTWSESSETSDFASVEASPAGKAASAAAGLSDPHATGHPQARLAGRWGGWLTGVTSAAGVVLGGAVRGGTKALQRLTAQERLQDLHAASQHLEATASGLQGEARVQTIQKWCALLRELHPSNLPLLHRFTLNALHPNSPHRNSCDSDWQQLQFAPEPPDPNAGHPAASTHPAQQQRAEQGTALGSLSTAGSSQHLHVAKGSELEFWGHQVLYLDQQSPPNADKDLLTFRELFLHSYALENILVGYVDVPASCAEDRNVLLDLFGLCLAGDSALHTRLVDTLLHLSAVEAECRGVGTAASLGPEQPLLANVVAETICGIKLQAECEVLDRKMASLKADIGEQAAEVHRNHKFNSGATEPTGKSSPTKLSSGLVGTAEVMQLGSRFQQLTVQRAAQVASRAQPQYEKYLGVAQAHARVLDTALADLETQADTLHKQKADGEAFRERKLFGMEGAMRVVDQEIVVLEDQQAELLRQLAIVQQQIAAAQAKRADMEEGRHVFQEGNAFTLEALQHKADGVSLQHQHHLAENAALAECQSLIQEAAEGWRTTGRAAGQSCQAALQQAGQEYMHAATRHLYYQRALLQLLLRQLTFCVSELQGLAEKEGSLERMGMEGIISDMRAGKQRLQAKYLEAHATAQQHFSDVAAVRLAVQAACTPLPKAGPSQSVEPGILEAGQSQQAADAGSPAMQAHPLAEPQAKPEQAPSVTAQGFAGSAEVASSSQAAGMSDELMDLFDSIHHLQQEVAALPSPEHVSPAGSGVQSRRPSTQSEVHPSGQAAAEIATDSAQSRHDAAEHTEASLASAASQLDTQTLEGAAGEASALAASSAQDVVACSENASIMCASQSKSDCPEEQQPDALNAADVSEQQAKGSSENA